MIEFISDSVNVPCVMYVKIQYFKVNQLLSRLQIRSHIGAWAMNHGLGSFRWQASSQFFQF